MQVDAAVLGYMQQLRRDDAAVGHHHDDLRGQLLDDVIRRPVPQSAGLIDRDSTLHRQLFDRRGRQDLLAAHRLIAAGKYRADLVPGVQQGLQAGSGNIRGAHEQDTHDISPRFLRGNRLRRNARPGP